MLVVLENNEDMGILDHEDLDHLFIDVSGSGYKAVSCTLLWLILYMTSYPKIQAKVSYFNPVALRKAKIIYSFGLSGCKRVSCPKY